MHAPAHAPGRGNDWLLWVVLSCYLLGLLIVAFLANRRKQVEATKNAVHAHFSGTFGALTLALTTVATVFSGYTVSGIPGDAAADGFLSFRWYTGLAPLVGSMLILYPRLRRLAMTRRYDSPNDFIADRFRSRRLRVLTCFCCAASSLVYLTVQFVSFAEEIHDISDERIPVIAGMIIFGALVLLLEAAGGLTSVIYSDAVQAGLMLLCFVVLPVLIFAHYGTPSSFIPTGPSCQPVFVDPSKAASKFAAPPTCSSPIDPGCVPSGCLGDVRPDLLAYPTAAKAMDQVLWWNLLMVAFPINFHVVQRVFVAKHDSGIKIVAISIFVAGFLAFTPGILLGLAKAATDPAWPAASREASPLAGSMEMLQTSGLARAVTTMTHCCYIAAIMSTSDSVIMGVSAALSLDMFKGFLRPDASTQQVVKFGQFVSVLQVGLSIICGCFVTREHLTSLFNFQNGALMQVAPAYFFGMFTNVCTIAITSGMLVGMGTLIALVSAVANIPMLGAAPSYIIALVANIFVIGIVQFAAGRLFYYDDDSTGIDFFALQDRWGPRLTPLKIESTIARSKPPSMAVGVVMILSGVVAAPLLPSASTDSLIGGLLPVWAAIMLACAVGGAVLGLIAIALWKIPVEMEDRRSTTTRDSLSSSIMSTLTDDTGRGRISRESREARLLSASISSWSPGLQLKQSATASVSTQATLQELGAPVL